MLLQLVRVLREKVAFRAFIHGHLGMLTFTVRADVFHHGRGKGASFRDGTMEKRSFLMQTFVPLEGALRLERLVADGAVERHPFLVVFALMIRQFRFR